MGYSISPASLRMDDLTETIVRQLRESGERTLTIAPETGSDRLRRVINKTVTNEEILDRTDIIFASGIENLKLYYMIGLPTETDEDLESIRTLTLAMRERMLAHGRKRGRLGRIIGSVNPLIPKPGTAYQWLAMEDIAETDRKIKRLRRLMSGIDNVYFTIKSERHSYYQALLSLGDRRVAPAIVVAERNGGNWRAAVQEAGIDADAFIFRDRSARCDAALGHHRRRHEGELLPIRVRQVAARGVDAAAQTRARERTAAPGPVTRRSLPWGFCRGDSHARTPAVAAMGDGRALDRRRPRHAPTPRVDRVRRRCVRLRVASRSLATRIAHRSAAARARRAVARRGGDVLAARLSTSADARRHRPDLSRGPAADTGGRAAGRRA